MTVRYGLLADIHANLPALRAAIATLQRRGVDRWIVAGDLVGYGPHPNECIEVVAELDAVTVAGNHDLIALGELSDERCIQMARDSLRWTRERLTDASRSFLADLPLRVVVDGLVVAHGSLNDPEEYTVRPEQATRQLDEVASRWPDARALILGHTHRPWAFEAGSGTVHGRANIELSGRAPVLINPGAVGQSRELFARARAGVADLESGMVGLVAFPYDVAACRAALRRAGLSPRSHHLRPSPFRLAGRVARRLGAFDRVRT